MEWPLVRRVRPLLSLFLVGTFVIRLVPKNFRIEVHSRSEPITLRQKFNPVIRRLLVEIPPSDLLDRRFVAGIALLVAAMDGRHR